ncbi:MAG TPA: asparaginase [Candidatus Limnocylindria bacterium]|nr:asparaginase [Candidatus Limnocylindria bacterium]
MTKPRIAILPTGGTIDHLGRDRLDLAFYSDLPTRLGPEGLLAKVPELSRVADIRLRDAPQLRGQRMGWPDLLGLSRAVEDAAKDVTGVVVTRGTNTLEETAYFLDLTVRTEKAVVVTGAMRPASAMSNDGELNLMNAVRVAAALGAHGAGALVVMNDEIFTAREIVKTATHRTHSFQAPGAGPVGEITPDGTVHLDRARRRERLRLPVPKELYLPRVDVILSYVGADGALIDAAVAAGARGIVHAGAGTGRGSAAEEVAFERAQRDGVVICQATRAVTGRVLRSAQMKERGIVAAGDLPPWKARLVLALALATTTDPEKVQAIFDRA